MSQAGRSPSGFVRPALKQTAQEADKAFEWLHRAYEKRDPGVMAILDNPFTHELRSGPCFGAFCKKVGLAWSP